MKGGWCGVYGVVRGEAADAEGVGKPAKQASACPLCGQARLRRPADGQFFPDVQDISR